ncbi:hypothetical protein [Streptomyces griseorubiginosus]|uniref:hypothetical protein n=1 Tax=Streptomyces griseorubiginosus TaxID=67304 RepID=UPI0036EA612D
MSKSFVALVILRFAAECVMITFGVWWVYQIGVNLACLAVEVFFQWKKNRKVN